MIPRYRMKEMFYNKSLSTVSLCASVPIYLYFCSPHTCLHLSPMYLCVYISPYFQRERECIGLCLYLNMCVCLRAQFRQISSGISQTKTCTDRHTELCILYWDLPKDIFVLVDLLQELHNAYPWTHPYIPMDTPLYRHIVLCTKQ